MTRADLVEVLQHLDFPGRRQQCVANIDCGVRDSSALGSSHDKR
jgi:hypothetical protein